MAENKEVQEEKPKKAEVKKYNFSVSKNALIVGGILLILALFLGAGLIHFKRAVLGTKVMSRQGMDREFGRGGMMERGNFRGVRMAENRIYGKVTAVDGKKLTVDDSGTNYTVQISDDTRFPLGSETNVKSGDMVVVFGEKDSSGIVQANRVMVNPENIRF